MENIVITILGVLTLILAATSYMFIRFYLKASRILKIERQVALLYEIQNHTEPKKLKILYNQYISNLDDPDWDSLIVRAKESMIRNLKPKTDDEHHKVFNVYQEFIYSIEDPIVRKSLHSVLFFK